MYIGILKKKKMNKEFVPYEPSLDLKELGFDEPCFGYYLNNEFQFFADVRSCNTNSEFGFYPTTPTFSQAFRFFREKYGLYHEIKMFGDWDKPQYSYIVSGRTMTNPAHMWYYEHKDSHEEAELACLKKLIELVKK